MKSSHLSDGRKRSSQRSYGSLLLGLFVFGGVAIVGLLLYLGYSTMMGGSAPQTAQQFTSATPGSHVQVAFEVTGLPSSSLLNGNLLQKNADGTYSRTGRTLSVRWDASKVVMGSSADVKVGAILQVSGTLDAHDVLAAGQVVILTEFVKLK
ncbi:MAG TPA: hypothetical protein VKY19_21730 [Ktedonosporobacter sp.]|nr:hypothetical protein [Ktedonosporobacter sp.]